MSNSCRPSGSIDDVEELIRNAELRTELEPYLDESISRVDVHSWTLRSENDFLESMLDWERAPLLPIYQWFDPPLELPPACRLADRELTATLHATIERLYSKGIVLDYADHLSDRELYLIIVNEILPLSDKRIDNPAVFHHWNCCNKGDDNMDAWLTYYATEEEREDWADNTGEPLPPRLEPAYKRTMPQDRNQ